MTVSSHIFAYCERGQDPAFWAEPLNALSNAGFLLAAAMAAALWWQKPRAARGGAEAALIGLVAMIGAGSFLFHTFATRWSAIADVAPIGIFMLAYTAFALRRFLGLSRSSAAAGMLALVAMMAVSFAAPCPPAMRGLVGGGACLNGSVGYAPALVMLAGVSLAAAARGQRPASGYLAAAAVVFSVSLLARTLDFESCPLTSFLGRPRGTHALWHLLNAATLFLLLAAALRHGERRSSVR